MLLAILCGSAADGGHSEKMADASPALADLSGANLSGEWVGGSSRPSENEVSQGVGRYEKKTPTTEAAKTKATFSRLLANMTSVPTTSATAGEATATAAEVLALREPSTPTSTTALPITVTTDTTTIPRIQAAITTVATPRLPMKFAVGARPKNTKKIVAVSLLTTTPSAIADAGIRVIETTTTTTPDESATANGTNWPAMVPPTNTRLPMKFSAGVGPKNTKKIVTVSLLTTPDPQLTENPTTEPETASDEHIISSVIFESLKIHPTVSKTPHTPTTTRSTSLPTEEKARLSYAMIEPSTEKTETTTYPSTTTTKTTTSTTSLPYAMKRKTQLQPPVTVIPINTPTTTIATTKIPTTTITTTKTITGVSTITTTTTSQPAANTEPPTTHSSSNMIDVALLSKFSTKRPTFTADAPTTTIRSTATPLPHKTKGISQTLLAITTEASTAADVVAAENNEIIPQASVIAPIAEQRPIGTRPVVLSTTSANQQQIAPALLFKPPPHRGTITFNPVTFQLSAPEQLRRASMHHFNIMNRIPLIHNRLPFFYFSPSTLRAI